MSGDRAAQVLLLLVGGGLVGWLFWQWEKDEQVERMGIAESEWKDKRAKVQKAMPDPWEKAWRKAIGIRRLGELKREGKQ